MVKTREKREEEEGRWKAKEEIEEMIWKLLCSGSGIIKVHQQYAKNLI